MQYKQIIVSGLTAQQERWIGLMQWYNDHVFTWQDIRRTDNGDGHESSGVDEALKTRDEVGWDEISFIQEVGAIANYKVQVSQIIVLHRLLQTSFLLLATDHLDHPRRSIFA
jgi:hypothetical protein